MEIRQKKESELEEAAVQSTMEPFVNSTSDRMCDVADVLDDTRLLKWAISRLRTFLYLSNPMDEAFQFVHQVADYHTEVSFLFNQLVLISLQ